MIEFIKQDITKENTGLIIHSCNAQGVMGSGVALAIKKKWPKAYNEYIKHNMGQSALGVLQIVPISSELYIGNLFGQLFYGRDNKRYADPIAIESGLRTGFDFCLTRALELKTVKLGCGLGGLNWENDILPIFNTLQEKCPNVTVKIFEM